MVLSPVAEARRHAGGVPSNVRHAWSRYASSHLAQVEGDLAVVIRIWRIGGAEQTRRARMCLHQRDLLSRAAGHSQVADGLLVDRPEGGRSPLLRRHFRKRPAVRNCKGPGGRTEELDKRSDHRGGTELFGERQHYVGHGDAVSKRSHETDTDEFRLREDVWLAQHDRFDLDTPNTPAQHAQGVHHWSMRVPGDGE